MNPDFGDAHQRHWDDAETLFDKQRWANADHLYGLAAECGLKTLMTCFGMHVDVAGNPQNRHDKVHIDKLWLRYTTYLSGKWSKHFSLPKNAPFSDWCVDQRYAAQAHFDQLRIGKHKNGANAVRRLLREAQRKRLI